MPTIEADICVIGGGSGGLSVAAGAVQLGARTVLIEKGRMGGDCLNYGCVPSKALLAAAKAAAGIGRARRFGVDAGTPAVDFARVRAHVRDVIAAIAPQDSVARFTGLGVTVLPVAARFVDRDTVEAGGDRVRARRFVVATGSSPFIPPVPGLADIPYLTNETVFDIEARPEHLLIVGGGPIGIEMAQAYRRLGSRVTVLEAATILPKDDPELVEVVRRRVAAEGVDLREGAKVAAIARQADRIAATLEGGDRIVGSHVLVAAGRRPTVAGLGLENAGVAYTAKGVTVDRRLRTSNRRIFAVGDATGGYQFTHVAGYHAGIVLRNALFRLPARVDDRAVPWVTYTDPELAQVGLGERAARERGAVHVLRWPFAENDRAQAERETDGLVKVVTGRRGRILGAGIVGAQAGELIQPWILAVARGMRIGAMAQMIAPYPTLGEAGKRAAGSYFTPALFSDRTRRIVRLLARLG
ncbi:MAG: FAD-dependent oxidoreductase [Alphaproteobacteria bacterium]|nr:FAD-dependent oxidoreductase [Alphaproteobacteria bacterium]